MVSVGPTTTELLHASSDWPKEKMDSNNNGNVSDYPSITKTTKPRFNTRPCLCQLGEACSGTTAAFAILKDPRGCFVELPQGDDAVLQAYCQYLRPVHHTRRNGEDNDSNLPTTNGPFFVAVHHFDPEAILQHFQLQDGTTLTATTTTTTGDLLPFPHENKDISDAARTLMADFVDENSVGWILPNYPFDQTHRDLRQCMQQRVQKLQEDTAAKRALRKTKRQELLEKFAHRMTHNKPSSGSGSSSRLTTAMASNTNSRAVAPLPTTTATETTGKPKPKSRRDTAAPSSNLVMAAAKRASVETLVETVEEEDEEGEDEGEDEVAPMMTTSAATETTSKQKQKSRRDTAAPSSNLVMAAAKRVSVETLVETVEEEEEDEEEEEEDHDPFASIPPPTQPATRQDSGMPSSTITTSKLQLNPTFESVGEEDEDEDDDPFASIPPPTQPAKRQDSGMPSSTLTPGKLDLKPTFDAVGEDEEEEEDDMFRSIPPPTQPATRQDSGMPSSMLTTRKMDLQPTFGAVQEDVGEDDMLPRAPKARRDTALPGMLASAPPPAAQSTSTKKGRKVTVAPQAGSTFTPGLELAPTFETCEEGEEDMFDTIAEEEDSEEDVRTPARGESLTRGSSLTRGFYTPSAADSPVVVSEGGDMTTGQMARSILRPGEDLPVFPTPKDGSSSSTSEQQEVPSMAQETAATTPASPTPPSKSIWEKAGERLAESEAARNKATANKASPAAQHETEEETDDEGGFRSLLKAPHVVVEQSSDSSVTHSEDKDHDDHDEKDDISALEHDEHSVSDPGRPVSAVDDSCHASQVSGLSAAAAPETREATGGPSVSRYNNHGSIRVFWGLIFVLSITNGLYAKHLKYQKALERAALNAPMSIPVEAPPGPWDDTTEGDGAPVDVLPPKSSWFWSRSASDSVEETDGQPEVLGDETQEGSASDLATEMDASPLEDTPKSSSWWFWRSSKAVEELDTASDVEPTTDIMVEEEAKTEEEASPEEQPVGDTTRSWWPWGRSPTPALAKDGATTDNDQTQDVEPGEGALSDTVSGGTDESQNEKASPEPQASKSSWFWGSSPKQASTEKLVADANDSGESSDVDAQVVEAMGSEAGEISDTEAQTEKESPEHPENKSWSSWLWGKSPKPTPGSDDADISAREEAEADGSKDDSQTVADTDAGELSKGDRSESELGDQGSMDVSGNNIDDDASESKMEEPRETAPTSSWFWRRLSSGSSKEETDAATDASVDEGDMHDDVTSVEDTNTLVEEAIMTDTIQEESSQPSQDDSSKSRSWFWKKSTKPSSDSETASVDADIEDVDNADAAPVDADIKSEYAENEEPSEGKGLQSEEDTTGTETTEPDQDVVVATEESSESDLSQDDLTDEYDSGVGSIDKTEPDEADTATEAATESPEMEQYEEDALEDDAEATKSDIDKGIIDQPAVDDHESHVSDDTTEADLVTDEGADLIDTTATAAGTGDEMQGQADQSASSYEERTAETVGTKTPSSSSGLWKRLWGSSPSATEAGLGTDEADEARSTGLRHAGEQESENDSAEVEKNAEGDATSSTTETEESTPNDDSKPDTERSSWFGLRTSKVATEPSEANIDVESLGAVSTKEGGGEADGDVVAMTDTEAVENTRAQNDSIESVEDTTVPSNGRGLWGYFFGKGDVATDDSKSSTTTDGPLANGADETGEGVEQQQEESHDEEPSSAGDEIIERSQADSDPDAPRPAPLWKRIIKPLVGQEGEQESESALTEEEQTAELKPLDPLQTDEEVVDGMSAADESDDHQELVTDESEASSSDDHLQATGDDTAEIKETAEEPDADESEASAALAQASETAESDTSKDKEAGEDHQTSPDVESEASSTSEEPIDEVASLASGGEATGAEPTEASVDKKSSWSLRGPLKSLTSLVSSPSHSENEDEYTQGNVENEDGESLSSKEEPTFDSKFESEEPAIDAKAAESANTETGSGFLGKWKNVATSLTGYAKYTKNAESSTDDEQVQDEASTTDGEGSPEMETVETAANTPDDEEDHEPESSVEESEVAPEETTQDEGTGEEVQSDTEVSPESSEETEKAGGVLDSGKNVLKSLLGRSKKDEMAPVSAPVVEKEAEVQTSDNENAAEAVQSDDTVPSSSKESPVKTIVEEDESQQPPDAAEDPVDQDQAVEDAPTTVEVSDEMVNDPKKIADDEPANVQVEEPQLSDVSTGVGAKVKNVSKRAIVKWYNSGFALESVLLVSGAYFYWGR